MDDFNAYEYYVGFFRYAQWGKHEYLVVAVSYYDDYVRELVSDLEGGDCVAINAGNRLKEKLDAGHIICGTGEIPSLAMFECEKNIIKKFNEDDWYE